MITDERLKEAKDLLIKKHELDDQAIEAMIYAIEQEQQRRTMQRVNRLPNVDEVNRVTGWMINVRDQLKLETNDTYKMCELIQTELRQIQIEEHNRKQYEKDLDDHECGYWSVCDDHACGCAISKNVDGFSNKVYQEMKQDLQRIVNEFELEQED